jgi:thioesterase domain-containing protein
LLAMLDTYPDAQSLSRSYRLRLAIQHSFFHLHEMQRLGAWGALHYFAHKLKGRLGFSIMPLEAASTREIPGLSFAQVPYRVQQKARIAMEGYRPKFYRGKIRFLAAKTSSFFLPPDPTAVWKKLCRDFELESLSCDHFEMMGPKRDYFASVLTHYVHEAVNRDSAENADANASGKQISASSYTER